MMTLLTTMFQSKWCRYGLLILAVLIGLWVGASKVKESIYQQGYSAGIAYQTQVYTQNQVKAQQQFDVLQAKADQDRTNLNKQITSLSTVNADLQKKLADKEKKSNQEKIDYAKTSAGSMSCFAPRDNGLFIINNSFPSEPD